METDYPVSMPGIQWYNNLLKGSQLLNGNISSIPKFQY